METKKFDQRTGHLHLEDNKIFTGTIVCPVCWKSVDLVKITEETYKCVACDILFDI